MGRRGKETSIQLRVAVVTLRFFLEGISFLDIANKLDLEERTCAKVWLNAVERASDPNDFRDLLACAAALDHPGKQPRVEDGTEQSSHIRQLILDHFDLAFIKVAHIYQAESGVKLSRTIMERIAHEHRDPERPWALVRGVRALIPALSGAHMNHRLLFSIWAIRKLQGGAIFIFTDETLVAVGGDPRRKPRETRPRGQTDERWLHALPNKKIQFTFMIWCAVVLGWRGPLPIKFWHGETEEEKERAVRQLNKENSERRQVVNNKRKRALEDGTKEHQILKDITNRVNNENNRRRQTGQRGRLHQKPPEKVFPYDDLTRGDRTKNGIDWYRHRQEVLRVHLYPFYFQVRAKYPDKEVWIVEDNASPHTTAAIKEQEWRNNFSIRAVQMPGGPGWPAKSPDLNMIEPCWCDLKDESHPRFWKLHGDSKKVVKQAEAIILEEWRSDKVRTAIEDHYNKFPKRLLQCIANGGNNTFKG
ncbi:hypothetical protein PV11_01248 [Exophiala sideris]|uniref:Tc1-like transposase DDE domain-containing protein n=1 Tax=Exophiala sideris TaxID=1016849 RepID=A0A0D1YVN6_9EURO|nr:hypothetical protein PV11_01248 [Exophiala sideris]